MATTPKRRAEKAYPVFSVWDHQYVDLGRGNFAAVDAAGPPAGASPPGPTPADDYLCDLMQRMTCYVSFQQAIEKNGDVLDELEDHVRCCFAQEADDSAVRVGNGDDVVFGTADGEEEDVAAKPAEQEPAAGGTPHLRRKGAKKVSSAKKKSHHTVKRSMSTEDLGHSPISGSPFAPGTTAAAPSPPPPLPSASSSTSVVTTPKVRKSNPRVTLSSSVSDGLDVVAASLLDPRGFSYPSPFATAVNGSGAAVAGAPGVECHMSAAERDAMALWDELFARRVEEVRAVQMETMRQEKPKEFRDQS